MSGSGVAAPLALPSLARSAPPLKLEAQARAWELTLLRLHHLAGMLRDLSLNPQTTEPEHAG